MQVLTVVERVPGGSWNEPSQFPEAGCLGLHNWKPRFPLFFPTILKFFYIGSTFSLDLCGGRMKKSVFQMCPLACNFFKNSLSGATVCGLLLFFWLRASNFQVTFSVLFVKILLASVHWRKVFFKVIFYHQVSGSNSLSLALSGLFQFNILLDLGLFLISGTLTTVSSESLL